MVFKPVFVALADPTRPKPVMAGGLAVFAAASAAFVIGGDPHLLGATRLAQLLAAASPGLGEGSAGIASSVGAVRSNQ